MVTQMDAVPVANPDNTALPEITVLPEILADSRLLQNSSLVPMGAYVMDWPDDYYEFRRMFVSVGNAYARMMTGQGPFILDFEYKKTQPASLQVKQVRELPHVVKQGGRLNGTNQFVIGDPHLLCEGHRVGLNSSYMAVRDLILGVDGHRQGLNRGHVESVQLC
jgi:hypothetical protein